MKKIALILGGKISWSSFDESTWSVAFDTSSIQFCCTSIIYWIGSLLDINESRMLFDNKCDSFINATISQVVPGYLSGIIHLINNEYSGLIFPDDLPYNDCMKYILPFLGDFIFTKCDYKLNDWTLNSFIIN